MYASDWVFCLFSNIIPIEIYSEFLDNFLTQGWPYFYGLCLALLRFFKPKILEEEEMSGILNHIKFKSPSKRKDEILVLDEETG